MGRAFLEKCIPAAIISNTEFPLNGAKIVEWLLSHGFSDYPLAGLSGMPFSSLTPEHQHYFGTTPARYMVKDTSDFERGLQQWEQVMNQVFVAKVYNDKKYLGEK